MKTLHVTVIIGIAIIVMTSIGIFVEKIGETQQQQPNIAISINGIKDNYTVNEPIAFSVTVSGYGSGCGDTEAKITNDNYPLYKAPGWGIESQCVSNPKLDDFRFNALPVTTNITQVGNYTLTASFGDSITYQHATDEKKFSVILPHITTITDIGITRGSASVTNTNFTVNYTIDRGKVLGMTYDTQTKSVMVSVKTSSKGAFTITLPRALVDSILPNGKDDKYIVLINDTKANYSEIDTTATNRTLAIPISQGTSTIEIIGEYLI